MFMETGEETVIKFKKGDQLYVVAVDDESQARMLNDGYVVLQEISKITRLPLETFDVRYPGRSSP